MLEGGFVPRQARLDAPGTLHHVIIRGIEKRQIVDDGKDRVNFVKRLGDLAEETKTAIYAWSLLTNHAHFLLRSGPSGLPKFMRRLLTGYAVTYNLRHHRHGHLFQNRYHSIVCDEDVYFRELVRYIHLNPLRAQLVKNLSELDRYPWCGHSAVIGRTKYGWQDRDYVLSWFGKKEKEARRSYRKYLEEGMTQGSRPELVGGGMVRSYGGWSAVLPLRKSEDKITGDQRILGTGDFVERVLSESGEPLRRRLSPAERSKRIRNILEEECQKGKIEIEELRMGSRRGEIPQVRSELAQRLIRELGVSLAEVARLSGVSTSAISKIMKRRG
jgi:REP element-mobilizing transposase RayT/predicted HTH domain antitoxin